jgi:hypothetical protein
MARQSDSTPAIINRVLKAAFPAHTPSVRLTRRRSKGGYNLSLAYSAKDELPALTSEAVYAALAQRLSIIKDDHSLKPTLDEVKAQFAVKSIIGIGPASVVGERPDGTTQYKCSGWLRGNSDHRVVVFLDVPPDGAAHSLAIAEELHPTAFFAFAQTTDLAVPEELKGKLLSADEAAALEPPRPARRRRRG